MQVRTFYFAGAETRTVSFPEDCVLHSAQFVTGSGSPFAFVSTDPNGNGADPADNLFLFGLWLTGFPLSISFSKGDNIFLVLQGVGTGWFQLTTEKVSAENSANSS